MSESTPRERRHLGYMVVAFLSLIGGIFIFAFIVIPQRRPETGVPRDVQHLFTNLYSDQLLVKNETGRFTPALITVNVPQDVCRRYDCLLTVAGDGLGYVFKLSKEGHRWEISQASPVPKEIQP